LIHFINILGFLRFTARSERHAFMAIPFHKELRIGAYLMKQRLLGRKRYPLVLMLEPLFRCNLACAGCGKIDYPDAILNRRMTAQECWDAADECGAPMVAIPGGEPLIHKEIGEIVRGLVARKKFVSLCTNALLLEKKLDLFEPSPYPVLLCPSRRAEGYHDKAVSQKGVFDRAVSAIKAAKAKRLRRQRQRHCVRRTSAGRTRQVSRLLRRARCRRDDLARLCL
jgi:hopanoid biosynthesis associated radical SAM protein HpnH